MTREGEAARGRGSFELWLGLILLGGLALRVAYLLAQPADDPNFAAPMQDGAYYVDWGRALASGAGGPGGAYYLAPLYPWLLAGFFTVFGENIAWLYLLQHAMVTLTALMLALCGRELAGASAGLATAALLLLYHPALFFASRPLGESVSLLLLSLALWLALRAGTVPAAAAGFLGALGSLARPNFLLVLAGWVLIELRERRWSRAALICAASALVIVPVATRNWVVSGHVVPISSNAGMTLYHGNGPGARASGVIPVGFSGAVARQRDEATRVAALRSGRSHDPVTADRWWGRQAIETRMHEPAGTAALLLQRLALLAASAELGLGEAPGIDSNPWRFGAPVPYGLLLGLALGALYVRGFRGSGGWLVWSAILASAATPILFYITSRYRLPVSVLLALPAGIGLASIIGGRGRRRARAAGLVAVVTLASFAVPAGNLVRSGEAHALANRGWSWYRIGDLERAESDLSRALEIDPTSELAHYNLGVLLERDRRTGEAERHFRLALETRASFAEAAQNLGALLIRDGRPAEAIAPLVAALTVRADHAGCWTNLVAAHYATGDPRAALAAAQRAAAQGVVVDRDLLREIELRIGANDEGISE